MDLGGAMFGALGLGLALVLLVVYAVSRSRHGKAPRHAEDDAHTGPDPTGDEDPVPREAGGGMPMVRPDEPDEMSPEQMQQRARGDDR